LKGSTGMLTRSITEVGHRLLIPAS
jgi:hypothetical protein